MKKLLIILIGWSILTPFSASADEGMWLVHLMEQVNYRMMKERGVKLKPEEIYNETQPSIKDAIVAIDYGSCTGSMISEEGLMITNHHCAYGDIQKLSTLEHDYLRDGFWAKNREDEIHIPGKTVMFLHKVIDITDEYKATEQELLKPGDPRPFYSRRIASAIHKKYKEEGYELSCEAMFRGNKYYLFYYTVYEDVRLVGAPSEKLGAFGGDTDNWSWPQHKCDFAFYRVYADKEGKPAKYSPENVPLTPRYVLPISIKGMKEKDFAMILGYPGSTSRMLPSGGVRQKIDITNPAMTMVREKKLSIMREAMNHNPEIKIKYASKYFNNSNYWKYAIGESKYTRRYNVAGIKEQEESRLTAWINANPERRAQYGDLIKELNECYLFMSPYLPSDTYHKETIVNGPDILKLALRFRSLETQMEKENCQHFHGNSGHCQRLRNNCRNIFKDYDETLDREIFKNMIQLYVENMHPDYVAQEVVEMVKRFNYDYSALTAWVYAHSCCSNEEKFMSKLNAGVSLADMDEDPALVIMRATQEKNYALRDYLKETRERIGVLRTLYTSALLEMNAGKAIYPDANSTMRITYGTVGGYSPGDGICYASNSSIAGYPEKYLPNDPEFDLPPGFPELLQKRTWGRYGDKKGELYTGFITDQDITGGNSGSPVMNARGELVGLAYDGNWESMAGDLYYHPDYNKCVSVDIRFVLWVVDHYYQAGYLIREMKITQ